MTGIKLRRLDPKVQLLCLETGTMASLIHHESPRPWRVRVLSLENREAFWLQGIGILMQHECCSLSLYPPPIKTEENRPVGFRFSCPESWVDTWKTISCAPVLLIFPSSLLYFTSSLAPARLYCISCLFSFPPSFWFPVSTWKLYLFIEKYGILIHAYDVEWSNQCN